MESDRRFLIKNNAKYVDGAWYWGEGADFGPESDYAIYLGDNSYVAARKLMAIMKAKPEPKQPWEMTAKEIEKPRILQIQDLEPTEPLQRTGKSKTKGPIKVWKDIDTGAMLIEDGHNRVYEAEQMGQKTVDAIITYTRKIPEEEGGVESLSHKEIVKKAIKENKLVPKEVLDEYPELKGKEGKSESEG